MSFTSLEYKGAKWHSKGEIIYFTCENYQYKFPFLDFDLNDSSLIKEYVDQTILRGSRFLCEM